MQTISGRIFELLKERNMSQKKFAQETGIAESTISDWKKKKTNPVSDKILIICEVLGVTPYELLSGAEHIGQRSRENMTYVIDKGTELGILVESYQQLDENMHSRTLLPCASQRVSPKARTSFWDSYFRFGWNWRT